MARTGSGRRKQEQEVNTVTHAMTTLVKMSALSSHEQLLDKAVNYDSHLIDDEVLDTWNWSSGEQVLIGVLKVIARGHSRLHLDDIYRLDKDNQNAVLLALRIRLGLLDEFGGTVL